MADQEEAVREFVAVTDVDEERARFFLESAGWDLQVRHLMYEGTIRHSLHEDVVWMPGKYD